MMQPTRGLWDNPYATNDQLAFAPMLMVESFKGYTREYSRSRQQR